MKLDHIALGIHSVEAGMALFATLGFTVLRGRGKHYANSLPTAFVTNPTSNLTVELIEVAGMPAPSLLHMAFEVEDIQSTCAKLLEQGYVYEREPFVNPANGITMAFLRHPDGLVAQINQPAS
jgi:catechol 2,3-dioxygenase-like lactoylglutathione lyase family enzyme